MGRQKLPNSRRCFNTEILIGDVRLVYSVSEFDDGSLAEIFIHLDKRSDLQTLLECFAISLSLGLQYGVPLTKLIGEFRGVELDPKGPVLGHDKITEAQSIIDFIFKDLEERYSYKDLKKSA